MKIGGARGGALVPDREKRCARDAARARAGLSAGDDLVETDTVKANSYLPRQRIEREARRFPDLEEVDRPEQRLGGDEPHGRRRRQQVRDARIGAGLVFDGDAEMDVGEWPRIVDQIDMRRRAVAESDLVSRPRDSPVAC